VTTGLWARSVLQHQYGVDLKKITWVLSGDEHVAEYRPPANVVPIPPGRKMSEMLARGELAAAIGIESDSPDVQPLIPDAAQAGFDALQRTGHYPINHLVVVKDEVLAAHPEVAERVFDAFARSKALYVERLRQGAIDKPSAVDQMHRRVMEITGRDPLPYGIEPNRAMLEQAVTSALEQGIITSPVEIDSLFASGTRSLAA
jgi:4,5-dihydroxyphthalate decarboxylase